MGEQKHTALLPCPFCGGSASMEQTESNHWSLGCDGADEPECMGYQSFTTFARRGEATKAWNTRAVNTYPAVADLVEALEYATGALQLLPTSERDIIKFTGRWERYGSMRVADILDRANAALQAYEAAQ